VRTHCKLGHPVNARGRCQICDRATERLRNARYFNDGLTPEERLERAKRRWTKLGEKP
jgi:hypothetical protein